MEPVFFRWNEPQSKLKNFSGYFLPGGFSYEDRVRSGVIAANDSVMEEIKKQASLGKPVIGICNGAQILVESGLIPGVSGNHLGASLAHNNRGYLNKWVNIKNDTDEGSSAFNHFPQNYSFKCPIANGEGRFVVPKELFKQLAKNSQLAFRYCDENGQIKEEYPINPNGAMYNLAGITNPAGNVLALMPHPERTEDGQVIFESIRKYLNKKNIETQKQRKVRETLEVRALADLEGLLRELKSYKKTPSAIEILVELIITDNEANTLEIALYNKGFKNIKIKRYAHWEVQLEKKELKTIQKIINSGELLNTNKEIPYVDDKAKLKSKNHKILVREIDDFTALKKLDTINNRLGMKEVKDLKKGVLWEVECSKSDFEQILKTSILFNPFSQIGLRY